MVDAKEKEEEARFQMLLYKLRYGSESDFSTPMKPWECRKLLERLDPPKPSSVRVKPSEVQHG